MRSFPGFPVSSLLKSNWEIAEKQLENGTFNPKITERFLFFCQQTINDDTKDAFFKIQLWLCIYIYYTIIHIICIPSYSYFIPWNAMKFHDLPSKDHWHEAWCGAERQQWPWPKKGHGHGNEDFSMENPWDFGWILFQRSDDSDGWCVFGSIPTWMIWISIAIKLSGDRPVIACTLVKLVSWWLWLGLGAGIIDYNF